MKKSGNSDKGAFNRMCAVCREHYNKFDMIKVVRDSDGNVSIDMTQKKAGRGAYVCKNGDCITKAVESKRFNKLLKCDAQAVHTELLAMEKNMKS